MGKKFFIKSLFIILSVYTLPNFAYAQKSEMDLTYDMFLQIKEEMTYEQVVGIIGHEGELISEAVAGTQTSKYYRWIYKKNKVIKHIMIMFMNDQVFVKQQYGLNQAEKSEPVIVAEPPAKKENVQPSPKVEVKTSNSAVAETDAYSGEFIPGKYAECIFKSPKNCQAGKGTSEDHYYSAFFIEKGAGGISRFKSSDEFKWSYVKGRPGHITATVTSRYAGPRSELYRLYEKGTKLEGRAISEKVIVFDNMYFVRQD